MKLEKHERRRRAWRCLLPVVCALLLAACGASPLRSPAPDEVPLRAMLAYYGGDPRAVETPREGAGDDPYLRLRQAIRLGQAKPPELPRALNLLEGVMNSDHPAAAGLAPLAHLLHDQYGERLRLEQRLREAQRHGDELQQKIDALSAIERSLPARPRSAPAPRRSAGGTP